MRIKPYRVETPCNTTHTPQSIPDKGSFLELHGEGDANREIPLEADPTAYATCDPCNAAQPRHWLLKGLITRRAYQVQGGAGLSFKFVPFVRWFGYSNQGKLMS